MRVHHSVGVLIALELEGFKGVQCQELLMHVNACAVCQKELAKVRSAQERYKPLLHDTEQLAAILSNNNCFNIGNDHDRSIFFLSAFLRESLSQETSIILFKHLSDCSDCMVPFVTGWTHFLVETNGNPNMEDSEE